MRILVCGSRDWFDRWPIESALIGAKEKSGGVLTVIDGVAPGADSIAGAWANRTELVTPLHFPANWPVCEGVACTPEHRKINKAGQEFCPTAGHLRNAQMLSEGKPDLVLAFTNDLKTSRGTSNMVALAKKAEIRTYVIGRA